jgi:hypothetical protein
VIGQPCSTVDPFAWVREGKVVVVSTARGTIGEDTAALIGGTLINLVTLLVGQAWQRRLGASGPAVQPSVPPVSRVAALPAAEPRSKRTRQNAS